MSKNTCEKLTDYIQHKDKSESLFGLVPASISGKIKTFATKAGVDIHTHSLRDYFATTLSEKGATIREIQSLLGHSNLTHTERYTLHTDKHLKDAIELIDQESEEKQIAIPQRPLNHEQTRKPIIVLKAVCKPSGEENTEIMSNEYHSHFVAYNDGDSPAIEVELALLGSVERFLEGYRETVLRVSEDLKLKPMLNRPEGKYYLICQYKRVSSDTWNQTCLPFKLKKASKENEIYVIPGELEFKFGISGKDKINLFVSKIM